MRVKAVTFALLAVSGIASARVILPGGGSLLHYHDSHEMFIEPVTRPASEPCDLYGQLVFPEELGNSSELSTTCENLRPLWQEGKVVKANYYDLADENGISYTMGSPIYGCSVSPKYISHRYPALCRALDTIPNNVVFAFSGPNYQGNEPFDGKPIAIRVGQELADVNIKSFNFSTDSKIAVEVFSEPNFSGKAETWTVPKKYITSFYIRSIRVRSDI